jgi:2-methylisocitrate lyase-like PEP mutase family enzyme
VLIRERLQCVSLDELRGIRRAVEIPVLVDVGTGLARGEAWSRRVLFLQAFND